MEPLSVSQVQAYLACPLKYRFQYIDKLEKPWRAAALAFGTSVHAAVEWYQRERMAGRRPDVQAVLTQFDADWYAANIEVLVYAKEECQESLAAKGHDLVALYLAQLGDEAPADIETPFEIDLIDPETGEDLELRLRGYIDLVEADGTVVDLKTAGRSIAVGDLERHLQLSVYGLVEYLRKGVIPALRLDILLKTKLPRFERHLTSRTIQDLSWTAKLVQAVASAIRSQSFPPNPSWKCGECEYFAHCQRWRG